MSQLADYPVLVDRSDALAILGVTASTFSRLCREGRFENRVCAGPPRELYMASELRRYRAQDKRLGASAKSVTNATGEPNKSAPEARTQPAQIVAGARNDLGLGMIPTGSARAVGGHFGLAVLTHEPAHRPVRSGRPGGAGGK